MSLRTIYGLAQRRTFAMSPASIVPKHPVWFGPFEVTSQVFCTTPHTFAFVNLKPLLPGHVLVSPHRRVARLTSLSQTEITDLFLVVQKVQNMLAATYFTPFTETSGKDVDGKALDGKREELLPAVPEDGSFNIAIQDGIEAGQSVEHLHVHIIPRTKEDGKGDGVYDELAGEEGNVGGKLWDRDVSTIEVDKKLGGRPVPRGKFPKIEDEKRIPRSKQEMEEEAEMFRQKMGDLERALGAIRTEETGGI